MLSEKVREGERLDGDLRRSHLLGGLHEEDDGVEEVWLVLGGGLRDVLALLLELLELALEDDCLQWGGEGEGSNGKKRWDEEKLGRG